jgi:hypothetical protein
VPARRLRRRRTRHNPSPIFTHAAELHALMAADYAILLEAAHKAAADTLAPNLVNARGRAAGIDSWDLFARGGTYATAYATPELLEWWQTHPRPNRHTFERQWLDTHLTGGPTHA